MGRRGGGREASEKRSIGDFYLFICFFLVLGFGGARESGLIFRTEMQKRCVKKTEDW